MKSDFEDRLFAGNIAFQECRNGGFRLVVCMRQKCRFCECSAPRSRQHCCILDVRLSNHDVVVVQVHMEIFDMQSVRSRILHEDMNRHNCMRRIRLEHCKIILTFRIQLTWFRDS